jgi:plasmid maintenance system antidote protein VapI
MTLAEYVAASKAKQSELALDMGCSASFVSYICSGEKPLPVASAIRLYRKRGVKLGAISEATDEEIEVLARFHGEQAA